MPATKIPARGALSTRWLRWRVRLRLETVMLALLGLLLIVIATWAHVGGVSVFVENRRLSCGSPSAPLDVDVVQGKGCRNALLARQVIRTGAILVLVTFVVAPVLVGWSRRRAAFRNFVLQDGATSLRLARRSDRAALRATIDETAMSELGWTADDRTAFTDSLISGPASGVLVVTEPGGAPIGAVMMVPAAISPPVVRLVFWVAPTRRRLGHGARALGLAMEHVGRPGVTVIAESAQTNTAAARLLESEAFDRTTAVGDRAIYLRPPSDGNDGDDSLDSVAGRPGLDPRPVGGLLLAVMCGFLAWSVFKAASNHFESVTILGPNGEIECGSLSSPTPHASEADALNCDIARAMNEPDRFRGVATGVLAGFGVLIASTLVLVPRARPAVLRDATRARPLTPAQVRDHVREAEPLTDGATRVRTVRPADVNDVIVTIDQVVTDAMGWSSEIRTGYGNSVAYDLAPGVFVVTAETDGRVLGVVSLEPVTPPRTDRMLRRVQVGTWMGAEGRGQGT